jgi:predicted AAA+ superfamily ATPase
LTFVGPAIWPATQSRYATGRLRGCCTAEGFVASEIVKDQLNQGHRKEIYYFRDHQGLEIDLVVPRSDHALTLIEANASRTVTPGMAKPLVRLRQAVSRYDVTNLVVHRGNPGDAALAAVWPGVKAIPVDRFLLAMAAPVRRRAHR